MERSTSPEYTIFHHSEAAMQGFEPCPRVLEARCSPRSTSLFVTPAPTQAMAITGAGSCLTNLAQLSIRTPWAA